MKKKLAVIVSTILLILTGVLGVSGAPVYAASTDTVADQYRVIALVAGLQDCIWIPHGYTSVSDALNASLGRAQISRMAYRLEYVYGRLRSQATDPSVYPTYLFAASDTSHAGSVEDALDTGVSDDSLISLLGALSGVQFKSLYDLTYLSDGLSLSDLSSLPLIYIDHSSQNPSYGYKAQDLYYGYGVDRDLSYRGCDDLVLTSDAQSYISAVYNTNVIDCYVADIRTPSSSTTVGEQLYYCVYLTYVATAVAGVYDLDLTYYTTGTGRLSDDGDSVTYQYTGYKLQNALYGTRWLFNGTISKSTTTVASKDTSFNFDAATSGYAFIAPSVRSLTYQYQGATQYEYNWARDLIVGSHATYADFGTSITSYPSGTYTFPVADLTTSSDPDTVLGVDISSGDKGDTTTDYTGSIDAVKGAVDDLRDSIMGGDYSSIGSDADRLSEEQSRAADAEDDLWDYSTLPDDFWTPIDGTGSIAYVMSRIADAVDALGGFWSIFTLSLTVGTAAFLIGF